MRLSQILEGLLHGELSISILTDKRQPELRGRRLVAAIVLLGAIYGAAMGLYGWRWGKAFGGWHTLAVMAKVPLLFLLTLAVTAPSLYVFAALGGSRLRFRATLRLFLAATALCSLVLASFAPVVAFFTFCTRSHPFMQLFNALLFTLAGLAGLRFLRRRLREATELDDQQLAEGSTSSPPTPRMRWLAFTAWFLIYGLVAAQMGWILRPFVGTPHLDQVLFRDTQSNIFAGLVQALKYLD